MEIDYNDFSPDQFTGIAGEMNEFILVTIPCYDEDDVLTTLGSLDKCENCGLHPIIILLINSPEGINDTGREKNLMAYKQVKFAGLKHTTVFPIHVYNIPQKIAGVGLARKMAMDIACAIYRNYHRDHLPIFCLDADSTVEKNYFSEIINFFNDNPDIAAISIYFEHPFTCTKDAVLKSGIVDYELHLRYFIAAQRWAGHPHAFQTIGSSMAVRSNQYRLQGGMNKRKAGEDFYFLHKYSKINALADLTTTTVYPGVRVSDRVPFGTGKALKDIKNGLEFTTYSFFTFQELKKIIEAVEVLHNSGMGDFEYEFPHTFISCFGKTEIEKAFQGCMNNSSSFQTFIKRFYYWFDAFKVFKFAHYCRDNFFSNQQVLDAVNSFVQNSKNHPGFKSTEKALDYFRAADKLRT